MERAKIKIIDSETGKTISHKAGYRISDSELNEMIRIRWKWLLLGMLIGSALPPLLLWLLR